MSGDSSVIIPLKTGYARVFGSRAISNGKFIISGISISAANAEVVDSVITQVEYVLRSQHKLGLNDDLGFSVSSQEQMLSSLSTISNTMSVYLGCDCWNQPACGRDRDHEYYPGLSYRTHAGNWSS